MNTTLVRRHALGLPAGSIRAAHVLVIVGLTCALLLKPAGDAVVAIPAYLIYLLFLILGHYFASHGTTIATRESGHASPLHLPAGSVRFLVILALAGAIGWKLYQDPEHLRTQFVQSLKAMEEQPYLPILILGAFLAGVILRSIVGRTNPPQGLQDFEAWVSVLALVGLGVALVIHLIVNPSLEAEWQLPTWEGVLGAVIAFYFGERS